MLSGNPHREHIASALCWCAPVEDEDEEGVWLHKGPNG